MKRATLVLFDEAAFCSDEILSIAQAFGAQDNDFKTSTDADFDPRKRPKQIPFQVIYSSSQDGMDTVFYKNYKDYAKRMIAGDRNYFVCDMPCTTAMQVYMRGEPYQPLLSQHVVDNAMKENPEKARREYYNIPTMDGGANQIVKWGTIRRNERMIVPYAEWRPENRIVMAFDPARTNDNSILSVMNLREDPELGLCGDIINCVNFIDTGSSKKFKLNSAMQLNMLKQYLLAYNGDNPDYEYIDQILFDAGSGGGGVTAYGDNLLEDWYDSKGKKHRGLIDRDNPLYETDAKRYRDAVDKLRLIDPRKYRTQMVQEFIELMELGVIKFPYEYKGQDIIQIPVVDTTKKFKRGEEQETVESYRVSQDERISFTQIDLMKAEITSIHKFENPDKTTVRYALPKEKENTFHDDRFYTSILLAHRLYELRRATNKRQRKEIKDTSSLFQIRAPKLR